MRGVRLGLELEARGEVGVKSGCEGRGWGYEWMMRGVRSGSRGSRVGLEMNVRGKVGVMTGCEG